MECFNSFKSFAKFSQLRRKWKKLTSEAKSQFFPIMSAFSDELTFHWVFLKKLYWQLKSHHYNLLWILYYGFLTGRLKKYFFSKSLYTSFKLNLVWRGILSSSQSTFCLLLTHFDINKHMYILKYSWYHRSSASVILGYLLWTLMWQWWQADVPVTGNKRRFHLGYR